MKKATGLLLLTILFGCDNSRAPQQHQEMPKSYTLTIKKEEINITGPGFRPKEEIDTVMAFSDTAAYSRAVNKWCAIQRAEKLTHYQVSRSHSFTIVNASGVDLKTRIPAKVTDSIDNYWKKAMDSLKDE